MKFVKRKIGLVFSVLFVSLLTSGYYKAVQLMRLDEAPNHRSLDCMLAPDIAHADVSIPYAGGEGGEGGEGGCG